MDMKVVAHGPQHQSYHTNLLSTFHSMQKTSSYTDCSLISCDGTSVPVHLALLSISWPGLEQLLPHSDVHCNCQALHCVPGIAVSGDLETVQLFLQLVYTGRTGLVGVEEERKVKQLLQVLGLELDMERVTNEAEYNNNKLCEGIMIPSEQKKTMIAPGTLMTRVNDCVIFFCYYCELEITKFSKEEKETHWAVVHFSEEMSKFTNDGACNICNRKFDTEVRLFQHVGVFHKKVYNFLLVLPLIPPVKTKKTPQKSCAEKFVPSTKYSSKVVSTKPGNKLVVPFVLVKCTFINSQDTNQPGPPHHVTTAYIEKRSVISKSASSMFPVIKQLWYDACFSSNNNSTTLVLTSLVSHYSNLLGEEDSEKCPYCPEKIDKHVSLSLHQSEDGLEVTEGKLWCGVCCQQILGEEQEFQDHLATHLLKNMDGPGMEQDGKSGHGSRGGKEFHLFFSPNSDKDCIVRFNDSSADKIKASVMVEEYIVEDPNDLGSDHNKCFDLHSSVINAINQDLVEIKEGTNARDENQVLQEEKILIEGCPRGRQLGQKKKLGPRGAHFRVPDHLKVAKKEYVPTGRPRGRLPGEGVKPDHLKKPKKIPSGKPRGRPKKDDST